MSKDDPRFSLYMFHFTTSPTTIQSISLTYTPTTTHSSHNPLHSYFRTFHPIPHHLRIITKSSIQKQDLNTSPTTTHCHARSCRYIWYLDAHAHILHAKSLPTATEDPNEKHGVTPLFVRIKLHTRERPRTRPLITSTTL